jgi:Arc/MetJ-type ribon-helix-helix transcriptional regulator
MMGNTNNEPMKEKVSVSLDKKTIEWLDAQVKAGSKYRSRSHVIEVAIGEKIERENKT